LFVFKNAYSDQHVGFKQHTTSLLQRRHVLHGRHGDCGRYAPLIAAAVIVSEAEHARTVSLETPVAMATNVREKNAIPG